MDLDHVVSSAGFGRLFVFARQRAKLKQWWIAEEMRTSQSTVAKLESATHVPAIRTLARAAVVGGCRLEIALIADDGAAERVVVDGSALARLRGHNERADSLERHARQEREAAERLRERLEGDGGPPETAPGP